MDLLLFVCLFSFVAGFLWGRHTTRIAFTKIFELFTNEMHSQYLFCLKKHGVKIRKDQPFSQSENNITHLAS